MRLIFHSHCSYKCTYTHTPHTVKAKQSKSKAKQKQSLQVVMLPSEEQGCLTQALRSLHRQINPPSDPQETVHVTQNPTWSFIPACKTWNHGQLAFAPPVPRVGGLLP